MTILVCGPISLLTGMQARLVEPTLQAIFLPELNTEIAAGLKPNDTLVLVQAADPKAAAAIAQALPCHYVEINTIDSPCAIDYGFFLHVGGLKADLMTVHSLLDQLAPCTNGWWHVGHVGAAAFMATLQHYRQFNPLGNGEALREYATVPATLLRTCLDYLELSENEQFVSYHPERQRALASLLDQHDSPARQTAKLLSLFAAK